MVDLSSIREADVLRGIVDADLVELGAIAQEQDFKRRDRLFERGKEARIFYIATGGRFALTVGLRVFDRSSEIVLEEKDALHAFGWSSLVEPRTSIYSGYCIEDGSAVAFPREPLEALMTTNYRLGEQLLHNLNELIGARVRVLQNLFLDEVSQMTARVQHWSCSELTIHWAEAMTEPHAHPARDWLRSHTHRGSGDRSS
jgi:CRP-like cAMP-binding protein